VERDEGSDQNAHYGSRLDRSHQAYLAGRAKMARRDHSEAAALFEQSNRAFPHFKTLELLGECKLALGEPIAALIPLAASVGLGTNSFRAMYLLAKAFADLGRRNEALKYVERALLMKPDFKKARDLKKMLATGNE
jgi:tetratricopeptide (TPR) repeat protein